jgi:hypothetical protein
MDEESFRRIIKFLLGFVEKVRHKSTIGQTKTNALIRTSTPSSWQRSLRLVSAGARQNDNGTMSRLRWVSYSTRTKKSPSWCRKATGLFSPMLECFSCFNFDVWIGCNDGMSDAKCHVMMNGYRRLILVGGHLLSFCDRYQCFEEFWYFNCAVFTFLC